MVRSPQIYRRLLGLRENEPVGEKFQASAGLLLEPKLHKAFDRMELSFYCKASTESLPSRIFTLASEAYIGILLQDGVIFAHFFRLEVLVHNALEWHGKPIMSSRFHIPFPEYWPRPDYLHWHYQQCLMARFRGFSA